MQDEALPTLHKLNVVTERTALSRSTLYRLIQAGHLNAVHVGKALRVSEAELRRFLASLESGALKV